MSFDDIVSFKSAKVRLAKGRIFRAKWKEFSERLHSATKAALLRESERLSRAANEIRMRKESRLFLLWEEEAESRKERRKSEFVGKWRRLSSSFVLLSRRRRLSQELSALSSFSRERRREVWGSVARRLSVKRCFSVFSSYKRKLDVLRRSYGERRKWFRLSSKTLSRKRAKEVSAAKSWDSLLVSLLSRIRVLEKEERFRRSFQTFLWEEITRKAKLRQISSSYGFLLQRQRMRDLVLSAFIQSKRRRLLEEKLRHKWERLSSFVVRQRNIKEAAKMEISKSVIVGSCWASFYNGFQSNSLVSLMFKSLGTKQGQKISIKTGQKARWNRWSGKLLWIQNNKTLLCERIRFSWIRISLSLMLNNVVSLCQDFHKSKTSFINDYPEINITPVIQQNTLSNDKNEFSDLYSKAESHSSLQKSFLKSNISKSSHVGTNLLSINHIPFHESRDPIKQLVSISTNTSSQNLSNLLESSNGISLSNDLPILQSQAGNSINFQETKKSQEKSNVSSYRQNQKPQRCRSYKTPSIDSISYSNLGQDAGETNPTNTINSKSQASLFFINEPRKSNQEQIQPSHEFDKTQNSEEAQTQISMSVIESSSSSSLSFPISPQKTTSHNKDDSVIILKQKACLEDEESSEVSINDITESVLRNSPPNVLVLSPPIIAEKSVLEAKNVCSSPYPVHSFVSSSCSQSNNYSQNIELFNENSLHVFFDLPSESYSSMQCYVSLDDIDELLTETIHEIAIIGTRSAFLDIAENL